MNPNASHAILDLYQEAQAASVDEFASAALLKLKRFVQFDSCASIGLHMGQERQMVITAMASFNVVPNKAALRGEYFGAETFDARSRMSSPDPLLRKGLENPDRAHAVSVERDIHDPRLFEYARRTESMSALAFISLKTENAFSSFNLWRAGVKHAFSRRDLAHADLFIPHIQQAFTINRKLAASSLIGSTQQAGTLVAESSGLIHHIDDLAILLLRREYPDWLSLHLPREITEGFRSGSAAHPASASTGRYVGRHILLSLRRQGGLMIIGVQSKTHGGKLTPAELRVVENVVRHGTYKDAARALRVSPATIRNQLHAIYRKLGIKGKSELVKVLPER